MTDSNSRSRRRSILPLVIGLPLIAVVAAVAIFFTSTGQEEQNAQTSSGQNSSGGQASPSGNAESGASGELDTPTLGEANAPVVMMEFSDYQ